MPGCAFDIILGLPWIRSYSKVLDWSSLTIRRRQGKRRQRRQHPGPAHQPLPTSLSPPPAPPPDTSNLSPTPPVQLPTPIHSCAATVEQADDLDSPVEALPYEPDPPDYIENVVKKIVPPEYHDLLAVFSKSGAETPPASRGVLDHKIEVLPGTRPFSERIRRMSSEKLAVLDAWVEEKLRLGQIEPSTSPWAHNPTFKREADDRIRVCIDLRGVNLVTVKNKTPLPLAEESFSLMAEGDMFTSIDLRSSFNQVLMVEISREKAAF
ncbi:uncharacterized protein MKK02DRAFT_16668, partial [Dioszegia hungarica]